MELGSAGVGTGMICYDFKSGSGSALRVVEADGTWTVAATAATVLPTPLLHCRSKTHSASEGHASRIDKETRWIWSWPARPS